MEVAEAVLPYCQQDRPETAKALALVGELSLAMCEEFFVHRSATSGLCVCVCVQCEPGPDFTLGEREMEAALKVLMETRVCEGREQGSETELNSSLSPLLPAPQCSLTSVCHLQRHRADGCAAVCSDRLSEGHDLWSEAPPPCLQHGT